MRSIALLLLLQCAFAKLHLVNMRANYHKASLICNHLGMRLAKVESSEFMAMERALRVINRHAAIVRTVKDYKRPSGKGVRVRVPNEDHDEFYVTNFPKTQDVHHVFFCRKSSKKIGQPSSEKFSKYMDEDDYYLLDHLVTRKCLRTPRYVKDTSTYEHPGVCILERPDFDECSMPVRYYPNTPSSALIEGRSHKKYEIDFEAIQAMLDQSSKRHAKKHKSKQSRHSKKRPVFSGAWDRHEKPSHVVKDALKSLPIDFDLLVLQSLNEQGESMIEDALHDHQIAESKHNLPCITEKEKEEEEEEESSLPVQNDEQKTLVEELE